MQNWTPKTAIFPLHFPSQQSDSSIRRKNNENTVSTFYWLCKDNLQPVSISFRESKSWPPTCKYQRVYLRPDWTTSLDHLISWKPSKIGIPGFFSDLVLYHQMDWQSLSAHSHPCHNSDSIHNDFYFYHHDVPQQKGPRFRWPHSSLHVCSQQQVCLVQQKSQHLQSLQATRQLLLLRLQRSQRTTQVFWQEAHVVFAHRCRLWKL